MPRPWCAAATQTGATPATSVARPSRRPGAACRWPTSSHGVAWVCVLVDGHELNEGPALSG